MFRIDRHIAQLPIRVLYLLVAPAVLLLTLYCVVFLALNSPTVQQRIFAELNARLYGGLTAGAVVFDPSMLRVDLYNARMVNQIDMPVVEIAHIGCSLAPLGLLSQRLDLHECDAQDGRVLVAEEDNGFFGVSQVFGGPWKNKRRVRRPLRVIFHGAEMQNIDVLLSLSDMTIYFEDIRAHGDIDTGPPRADVRLDGDFGRGRILLSERLFSLGPGRHSMEQSMLDIERRTHPWRAVQRPLPPPGDGGPGMLDIPVSSASLRGFHWLRNDFTVDDLRIDSPEIQIGASGALRLVPERPKLPQPERGLVYYDGQATLIMPPDTALAEYFLPGLIQATDNTAAIGPIDFDGFGTLRFYDGMQTRLRARALTIAGLRIDEADIGAEIHDGVATLASDSWIQAYGARLTGWGEMRPAEGTWQLNLCADGINMLEVVESFVPIENPSIRAMLAFKMVTTPSECDPQRAAGIQLHGDLTRKALELSPASSTPAGKPIQPPMIEWRATGVQLRWGREPPMLPTRQLTVDSSGALEQTGLIRENSNRPLLRVRAADALVRYRGGYDLPTNTLMAGRAHVEFENLRRWTRAWGISGVPDAVQLRVDAHLDGPAGNPLLHTIEAQASRQLRNRESPDFDVLATMDVVGRQLVVRQLAATSWLGDIQASGSLGLFGDSVFDLRSNPTVDAEVTVPSFRIGRLFPAIGSAATAAGIFRLGGTLNDPEVEGENASLDDVSFGGEPIDSINVQRFVMRDDIVTLQDMQVEKGSLRLAADLDWDVVRGDVVAQASAHDIDLRDFAVLEASGLDVRGRGRMLLELEANTNDLSDARFSGYLTLQGIEVQRYALGDLSFVFDSWDGEIHGSGTIGADVQLRGIMPLDGEAAILRGEFTRISVEDWWPESSSIVDDSRISGQVEVVSAWWADQRLEAHGAVETAEFSIDDRHFVAPRPWTASLLLEQNEDGQSELSAVVDDFSLALGSQVIEGRGRATVIDGETELTLLLDGDLDVSLLRFLPDLIVDAQGAATVGLKIDGPLSGPNLAGRARYGELSIAPRGLGASVLLRPGEFTLNQDRATFSGPSTLRGSVFGGEFEATGEVGLRQLLPASVDMELFFNNVGYRVPEVMNITVGGGVRFVAGDLLNFSTWGLSGSIDLVDGRFIQNFDILADYFALGNFGRNIDVFALPVWRTNEALRDMSADLSITGRDRFFVDSRVANAEMNLEMRTDLEVRGTFGNMDVRGEMETLDGSRIVYRGRTFETELMILHFDGVLDDYGYPMPRLESELVSSIRPCVRRQRDSFDSSDASTRALNSSPTTVLVTAYLDGQLPYDLSFRLESTPFYDQRDQLSLILAGCTVDELTASQAGAPTLDVVLRPVLELVERNVEERLSFDDVDFIPTTQGSAGILIQDEITERFSWTLDATVGAGEQNQQVVRGAYRVFDWLILEVQEQTNRVDNIRVDTGIRFRLVLD
jgi:hypothetical protein